MSWEESQGIPSIKLNQFSKDVTDRIMRRLSVSHGVKMAALGYRDSEPKDIITPDIPTPAILIKFIRIRPKTWVSQGRTIVYKQNNRVVVELMFKAYAIIRAGEMEEGEEDQELAVALAVAINSESKFGHAGAGPSQLQDIRADGYVDFNEEEDIDCKDSFVIWRVDWYHDSLIGETFTEGYYDIEHFQPVIDENGNPLMDNEGNIIRKYQPIDPLLFNEVYLSFDSQEGKIEMPAREITLGDHKTQIFEGVNPDTGETFESNYVLISRREKVTGE